MKQNQKQSSTHRPTFSEVYAHFEATTHDWTEAEELMHDYMMAEYAEEAFTGLRRPNPPTKEAIEKAKFVDKTYRWNGR